MEDEKCPFGSTPRMEEMRREWLASRPSLADCIEKSVAARFGRYTLPENPPLHDPDPLGWYWLTVAIQRGVDTWENMSAGFCTQYPSDEVVMAAYHEARNRRPAWCGKKEDS